MIYLRSSLSSPSSPAGLVAIHLLDVAKGSLGGSQWRDGVTRAPRCIESRWMRLGCSAGRILCDLEERGLETGS